MQSYSTQTERGRSPQYISCSAFACITIAEQYVVLAPITISSFIYLPVASNLQVRNMLAIACITIAEHI